MIPKYNRGRLTRAALVVVVALGLTLSQTWAAPPKGSPIRVAVAKVSDRRVLSFPNALPLFVENPYGTLTAQPRSIPDQVKWRIEKTLSQMNGLVVVQTLELTEAPSVELVRAAAARLQLDAVFIGALTVGFGQMRVTGFRRRTYEGRVQVALDILSGLSGRPLAPTLLLEGEDKTIVDFRRGLNYDTLHHTGAGPEVRERTEWAVREVGRALSEKVSSEWLAAALAEDSRTPEDTGAPRVSVDRVALEPADLQSGQLSRMVITYELSGLPEGSTVAVRETRRLLREERLVGGPFQSAQTLGNGRHTSVQELRVPATAESGLYTIQGIIEAAGARDSASGQFTVKAP